MIFFFADRCRYCDWYQSGVDFNYVRPKKCRTNRILGMKHLEKQKAAEASKILMVLASAVLVIAGMKASADFIIPVLLAFFIATVSFPITSWLREHRVPRVLAVMMTVLVDFAFIAGIVVVGVLLVSELQTKWTTKYQSIARERLTSVAETTDYWVDRWGLKGDTATNGEELDAVNESVTDDSNASPVDSALLKAGDKDLSLNEGVDAAIRVPKKDEALEASDVLINQFMNSLSVGKVWEVGTDFLWKLIGFLGTSFVVLLLTVFMLSEARMFGRRFSAICEARGPNLQRMLSATKDIQRYLGIKTMISFITGFLAGVLCWAMDVDLPLLWGILAFGLNFVPAIGSVIAGIPPVLLTLVVTGEWQRAAVVGGGYLLINGFLGNFLEPMLLGRRFGLSTLVVVVSVIFWGWLWGPVGMLLAVPLTMLLKVAMDNSSDFRWIAVAISKEGKGLAREEEKLIKEAVENAAESRRKKLVQEM